MLGKKSNYQKVMLNWNPKSMTTQTKARIIRERFGSKCTICGFDEEVALVLHHRIRKADGGKNNISNLECLCCNCHAKHHAKNYRSKPVAIVV